MQRDRKPELSRLLLALKIWIPMPRCGICSRRLTTLPLESPPPGAAGHGMAHANARAAVSMCRAFDRPGARGARRAQYILAARLFLRYHYDARIPVEKVPSSSIMMPQEVINQGDVNSHIRGRNEVSGREAIRGCCWP